jgi:2-phosphoglycerate kinase
MKPIICIVTGPAAVGKSTITKELAKKFTNSARIDVDYIREMIVNGYAKPFRNNKKTKAQLLLSRKNACSLAKNFIESGFCVFIDDVISKKSSLDFYLKSLCDYRVFVFLLFCDKDVLYKRDTARTRELAMGKRAIQLHNHFSKRLDENRWFIVDTSKSAASETAKQIMDIIKKNSF